MKFKSYVKTTTSSMHYAESILRYKEIHQLIHKVGVGTKLALSLSGKRYMGTISKHQDRWILDLKKEAPIDLMIDSTKWANPHIEEIINYE